MERELVGNNGSFVATWESDTSILKASFDQTGTFICIKQEVWKDMDSVFNRS